MINIDKIGDYSHFSRLYSDLGYNETTLLGRVCAGHGNICKVITEQAVFDAEVKRGVLENQGPLVTGDWVVLSNEGGTFFVNAVLKRKNEIARRSAGTSKNSQVLGANIDIVFIVSGLDNNFNPSRIERFLTLVLQSGATPVIILNKSDICPDTAEKVFEVECIAPGVDVLPVSALTEQALDTIEAYLEQGKTAVFLGSSGVGKSTLVNKLIKGDLLKTTEVRISDSKGRHTTTSRELFFLESGGILMDTPGLREIQLLDNQDGLDQTFGDILELSDCCKFSDCTHQSEPGCAVRRAIENQELDPRRLENYLKMQKEIAYYNQDKKKSNSKRKWKDINKSQKQFFKHSLKYK